MTEDKGEDSMGKEATVLALVGILTLAPIADAAAVNCVQYVRSSSDFDLHGDAWHWWNNAAGVYDRGKAPRAGSVMVFKRAGAMRRGHVALVSQVIDRKTVLIDHANWASKRSEKGRVDRRVAAIDCSARHDWSAVCVWNKKAHAFGGPHPTSGFIYA